MNARGIFLSLLVGTTVVAAGAGIAPAASTEPPVATADLKAVVEAGGETEDVSAVTPAPAAAPVVPEVTPESLPGAETHLFREGGPEPMRLHVFKPKGWKAGGRRGAWIHFFGGGFLRGTPVKSAGWAKLAARWGLVGIAPDYRTKDRFGTDARACVADARAALRWVQAHAEELGVDPARIVVSGSSAGGHLALWTAIEHTPPGSVTTEAPQRKPAALVLFSAAADTTAATGERNDRFGGDGDALSATQNLDAAMPPVLMFHGDADVVVKFPIAQALDRTLRESGNACEFVIVPGGGHAFMTELPEWRKRAEAKVREFLIARKLLGSAP